MQTDLNHCLVHTSEDMFSEVAAVNAGIDYVTPLRNTATFLCVERK